MSVSIVNICLVLVILFVVYFKASYLKMLYKSIPKSVRILSLLLLVLGCFIIEFWLRYNGAKPYFIIKTGHENGFSKLVHPDSLRDYQVFICDSFGVNKFNIFSPDIYEQLLNDEGFRSHYSFSQHTLDSIKKTGEKSIFLIGDSYSYGMTADSGFAFADILDNTSQYAVLNAGIPGTDLPQYKAVINEYIVHRKLKPDLVLVCITGNDLDRRYMRRLTPNMPILFYTNVGGIYSFQDEDDTTFATAKSAYQNILNKYTLYGRWGQNKLIDFIGKSVLVSRFMGKFIEVPKNIYYPSKDPAFDDIKAIKKLCNNANVPLKIIFLPGSEYAQKDNCVNIEGVVSLNPKLFYVSDFTKNMDNHPLNSGHKKIAVELLKILKEE